MIPPARHISLHTKLEEGRVTVLLDQAKVYTGQSIYNRNHKERGRGKEGSHIVEIYGMEGLKAMPIINIQYSIKNAVLW